MSINNVSNNNSLLDDFIKETHEPNGTSGDKNVNALSAERVSPVNGLNSFLRLSPTTNLMQQARKYAPQNNNTSASSKAAPTAPHQMSEAISVCFYTNTNEGKCARLPNGDTVTNVTEAVNGIFFGKKANGNWIKFAMDQGGLTTYDGTFENGTLTQGVIYFSNGQSIFKNCHRPV